MPRRVVVTGLGAMSPNGVGKKKNSGQTPAMESAEFGLFQALTLPVYLAK